MRRFRRGEKTLFRDRIDAGEQLAEHLQEWRDTGALVLGLPRGGVPVAAEVARALAAELDVVVARKVGAPRQPELAIGAVTADGGVYIDDQLAEHVGVDQDELEQLIEREQSVARKRNERFRGDHAAPKVSGRTVIVVDDGLATGATMRAALHALRKQKPGRLIVAVPVGSTQSLRTLEAEADEVVCPHPRQAFQAVGLYFKDFSATEDEEVEALLRRFRQPSPKSDRPES